MNGFRLIAGLIIALFTSGCAIVQSPLEQRLAAFVKADVARGKEIAANYGAPEIASCLQFIEDSFSSSDGLLKEKIDGVVSLSVKLYLLSKLARVSPEAEKAFKDKCGPVIAEILLEAAKNAPIPIHP